MGKLYFTFYARPETETNTQTDTLITIFRSRTGGRGGVIICRLHDVIAFLIPNCFRRYSTQISDAPANAS